MTSALKAFWRPESSMEVAVVHLSRGFPLGVCMPRVWLAVADSSNIGLQKLSIQSLSSAIGSHLGCLAD